MHRLHLPDICSTQSIATPNTILNTIVADSLCEIADELEKADNFDMAVHDKIKELIAKHKRIIFNGNGYSEEWIAEAERRGLPNIKCLVDAVCAFVREENVTKYVPVQRYPHLSLSDQQHLLPYLLNTSLQPELSASFHNMRIYCFMHNPMEIKEFMIG